MNKKAFTLLELLIVLLLIGIGLMSITPRMLENIVEPNRTVKFFNDLLGDMYEEAKKQKQPVFITGFKGSSKFLLPDGSYREIPENNVNMKTEINEIRQLDNRFHIYIYPQGVCDYFVIELSNGKHIESIPLIMRVKV